MAGKAEVHQNLGEVTSLEAGVDHAGLGSSFWLQRPHLGVVETQERPCLGNF